MSNARHALTVRLRERNGHERANPKTPEPFVIEIGYPVKTAPTKRNEAALLRSHERGLMIAMLFTKPGDIIGAMHGAAELWAGFIGRHKAIREGGIELVRWRIPGGGMADVQMRPSEIAGHLHTFAEHWERAAREAFSEHQAALIMERQPFRVPPSTGLH